MTARSYRIEDFVQDMTALLERVPDQQELFDRGVVVPGAAGPESRLHSTPVPEAYR